MRRANYTCNYPHACKERTYYLTQMISGLFIVLFCLGELSLKVKKKIFIWFWMQIIQCNFVCHNTHEHLSCHNATRTRFFIFMSYTCSSSNKDSTIRDMIMTFKYFYQQHKVTVWPTIFVVHYCVIT